MEPEGDAELLEPEDGAPPGGERLVALDGEPVRLLLDVGLKALAEALVQPPQLALQRHRHRQVRPAPLYRRPRLPRGPPAAARCAHRVLYISTDGVLEWTLFIGGGARLDKGRRRGQRRERRRGRRRPQRARRTRQSATDAQVHAASPRAASHPTCASATPPAVSPSRSAEAMILD